MRRIIIAVAPDCQVYPLASNVAVERFTASAIPAFGGSENSYVEQSINLRLSKLDTDSQRRSGTSPNIFRKPARGFFFPHSLAPLQLLLRRGIAIGSGNRKPDPFAPRGTPTYDANSYLENQPFAILPRFDHDGRSRHMRVR
jgi:hypothetical protein